MDTVLSFPGLGIGEFTVHKEMFSIGNFSVRYYGVFITIGIILAFLYAIWRAKGYGIKYDQILDITLFTILFAIIGARLYYVLTSLDKYTNFWDVFKIWEGGLGIYGGVIAGVVTVLVCAKVKKLNVLHLLDSGAPGLMLAQAIGRWGNFMNGEAYGAEVTGGPLYFLRMGINPHYDITTVSADEMAFVHPTFLYESLWNILGFVLINVFYKKKKFDGEIILWYATWYGFGRFFIEMLRTDSLYIPGTSLKISCVVGLLSFVVGLFLIIFFRYKAKVRETANAGAYEPMFAKDTPESAESTEEPETIFTEEASEEPVSPDEASSEPPEEQTEQTIEPENPPEGEPSEDGQQENAPSEEGEPDGHLD